MTGQGRGSGWSQVGEQVGASQFSVWSPPDADRPTLATGIRGRSLSPCTEYHLVLLCPGVMPPDEYHSGVDNSVYTNVLVQNRSDPRTRPTSTMQGANQECRAAAHLSPSLLLACALLLPWPRTWVSPSLTSGWWWLIRSRCPLTRN